MQPAVPAGGAIDRIRDMLFLCGKFVGQHADLNAVYSEVGDPTPDEPVPKIFSELDAGIVNAKVISLTLCV